MSSEYIEFNYYISIDKEFVGNWYFAPTAMALTKKSIPLWSLWAYILVVQTITKSTNKNIIMACTFDILEKLLLTHFYPIENYWAQGWAQSHWVYIAKMGDSDSGVGVKPGVDSSFGIFGVGVGIGVNIFFTTGVGARVGVNRLTWSRSRSRSQEFWSLSMYNKKKCNVPQLN